MDEDFFCSVFDPVLFFNSSRSRSCALVEMPPLFPSRLRRADQKKTLALPKPSSPGDCFAEWFINSTYIRYHSFRRCTRRSFRCSPELLDRSNAGTHIINSSSTKKRSSTISRDSIAGELPEDSLNPPPSWSSLEPGTLPKTSISICQPSIITDKERQRRFQHRAERISSTCFWARRKEAVARAASNGLLRAGAVKQCYAASDGTLVTNEPCLQRLFHASWKAHRQVFKRALTSTALARKRAAGEMLWKGLNVCELDVELLQHLWGVLGSSCCRGFSAHIFVQRLSCILVEQKERGLDGEFALETPYELRVRHRMETEGLKRRSRTSVKRHSNACDEAARESATLQRLSRLNRRSSCQRKELNEIGQRSDFRQMRAEVLAYDRLLDSLGYSPLQIDEAIEHMFEDGEILVENERLDRAIVNELITARRLCFATHYDSDVSSSSSSDEE